MAGPTPGGLPIMHSIHARHIYVEDDLWLRYRQVNVYNELTRISSLVGTVGDDPDEEGSLYARHYATQAFVGDRTAYGTVTAFVSASVIPGTVTNNGLYDLSTTSLQDAVLDLARRVKALESS